MPKDRFYTNQDLKKDICISITAQEACHMYIIMRKRKDDEVEIINGKGFLAKAKILNISKNQANLKIENIYFEEEKKQKLILVQSIIKPDRLDLVFEKCAQLGADEFHLFPAINSRKTEFSKNRLDRTLNILIAAIKQCGRLYLPKIKILTSIKDFQTIKSRIFFGSTDKNCTKLIDALKKEDENIYFIIGPQKGFTDEETNFMENDLKALPVKLNENILRSETAAITAIAITSHLLESYKLAP